MFSQLDRSGEVIFANIEEHVTVSDEVIDEHGPTIEMAEGDMEMVYGSRLLQLKVKRGCLRRKRHKDLEIVPCRGNKDFVINQCFICYCRDL